MGQLRRQRISYLLPHRLPRKAAAPGSQDRKRRKQLFSPEFNLLQNMSDTAFPGIAAHIKKILLQAGPVKLILVSEAAAIRTSSLRQLSAPRRNPSPLSSRLRSPLSWPQPAHSPETPKPPLLPSSGACPRCPRLWSPRLDRKSVV